MFSRILLLSLPATVWSQITVAPQSLDKFKEEYNTEKARTLDSALKILTFNNEIRGSATPKAGSSSAYMWEWYSSVTGSKKVEAQQFMEKVEKDGLVHEQVLGSLMANLTKVLAGSGGAKLKDDAINLNALMGSTKPAAAAATGVIQDTVNSWDSLQIMTAATKAQVIELAKAKMYEKWSTNFDTDFKTAALADYPKITQCFAETIQADRPAGDTVKGQTNWDCYSILPAEIQTKMRAYMLEKMRARVLAA